MPRNIPRTLSLLFMNAAIISFVSNGSGGCGATSATTEPLLVAKIAQSDVPDNMLSLLTAFQALPPAAAVSALSSDIPGLVDVSSGPSCSEAPSPTVNTPPTYVTRILPFHINGGVSGSCGLTADTATSGNVTTISMLLFCEDLVVQETLDTGETRDATYNGQIGFTGTVTDDGNGQKTLDFVNSSKGLTVQLGSDDPCDVVLNLHLNVIGQDTSGQLTEDGCVMACGQGFTVSGTQAVP